MHINQVVIIVAILLGTFKSYASPDCKKLVDEIKAMKATQQTLLENMLDNSQTMATTLDQYAGEFKEASSRKLPLNSKEVLSLHQSAETFRAHGQRETKLISKFNKATEELLKKVEVCMMGDS